MSERDRDMGVNRNKSNDSIYFINFKLKKISIEKLKAFSHVTFLYFQFKLLLTITMYSKLF